MSDDFDLEFGDDLDFDGGGGDGPEPSVDAPSANRTVVSELPRAYYDNISNELSNPRTVASVVERSMPRGYDRIKSRTDQFASLGAESYRKAADDLRPTVTELKKTTARALPKVKGLMPESIYKKLEGMTEGDDDRAQQAAVNADEQAIASTIGNIFAAQQQRQEEVESHAVVKEAIDDNIDSERHKETTSMAKGAQDHLASIVGYQNTINSEYQKKMLEIAMRTYFTLRDMGEVQKMTSADTINALQAIMKNTALPEFQKLKMSEANMQHIRERITGKAAEMPGEWLAKGYDRFAGKVKTKVNDTVEQVKSQVEQILEMVNMSMDQEAQAAEMSDMFGDGGGEGGGEDTSSQYTIGGLTRQGLGAAGSNLAERTRRGATTKIAETVRDLFIKFPQARSAMARGGHYADHIFEMMNEKVRDGQSSSAVINWIGDKFGEFFDAYSGDKIEVLNNLKATAFEKSEFTRRSDNTLNTVIPDLLVKIWQSSEGIRTGKVPEALVFNYDREEMTTAGTAIKDVQSKFHTKADIEKTKEAAYKTMDKIGETDALSDKARDRLMLELVKRSRKGDAFDPIMMAKDDTYSDVDDDTKLELTTFMNERFKIKDGKYQVKRGDKLMAPRMADKIGKVSKEFGNIKGTFTKDQDAIAGYQGVGQKDLLRKAGIIGKDMDDKGKIAENDTFRHDRFWNDLKQSGKDGRTIQGVERPVVASQSYWNVEEIARNAAINSNTIDNNKFIRPVNGDVIAEEGDREHPVTGRPDTHTGVDVAAREGETVVAVKSGKIIKRTYSPRYGNVIVIKHSTGSQSLYGHLSDFGKFVEGDDVKQGDVIGYIGDTGLANGAHLHFELRGAGGSDDLVASDVYNDINKINASDQEVDTETGQGGGPGNITVGEALEIIQKDSQDSDLNLETSSSTSKVDDDEDASTIGTQFESAINPIRVMLEKAGIDTGTLVERLEDDFSEAPDVDEPRNLRDYLHGILTNTDPKRNFEMLQESMEAGSFGGDSPLEDILDSIKNIEAVVVSNALGDIDPSKIPKLTKKGFMSKLTGIFKRKRRRRGRDGDQPSSEEEGNDESGYFGKFGKRIGQLAKPFKWTGKLGWDTAKLGFKLPKWGVTTAFDKVKKMLVTDVYVKGKKDPVLLKRGILEGIYIDVKSGKPVTKFKDITGPVKDLDGNQLISQEEFDMGLLNNRGKSILSRMTSGVTGMLGGGIKLTKNVMLAPIKWAATEVIGVYDFMGGIHDVYIKGEKNPRLTAAGFKSGLYYSVTTDKIISNAREIDGAILNEKMDQVISAEEAASGNLVTVFGKPIRTHGMLVGIGNKIGSLTTLAGKAISGTLKGAKAIGKFGLDVGKRVGNGVAGLLGMDQRFNVQGGFGGGGGAPSDVDQVVSQLFELRKDVRTGFRHFGVKYPKMKKPKLTVRDGKGGRSIRFQSAFETKIADSVTKGAKAHAAKFKDITDSLKKDGLSASEIKEVEAKIAALKSKVKGKIDESKIKKAYDAHVGDKLKKKGFLSRFNTIGEKMIDRRGRKMGGLDGQLSRVNELEKKLFGKDTAALTEEVMKLIDPEKAGAVLNDGKNKGQGLKAINKSMKSLIDKDAYDNHQKRLTEMFGEEKMAEYRKGIVDIENNKIIKNKGYIKRLFTTKRKHKLQTAKVMAWLKKNFKEGTGSAEDTYKEFREEFGDIIPFETFERHLSKFNKVTDTANKLGGKLKKTKVYGRIADRLGKAKESVQAKVKDVEEKGGVREAIKGLAKSNKEGDDKVAESDAKQLTALDKIATLLKPKKKVAGDKDGDGDRDGGWRDQMQKRKAKMVQKRKDKKEAKATKRSRSKMAGLASMMRKNNKDGDDEGGGFFSSLGSIIGTGLTVAGGAALLGAGGAPALLAGSGGAIGAAAIAAVPWVVGAAVVAGTAYAGWQAFKYMARRTDLEPLERFRFASYGVDLSNEDMIVAIRYFEDEIEEDLEWDGDKPILKRDPAGVFKDFASDFGADEDNSKHARSFSIWYTYRFLPIYLRQVAQAKALDVDLLDIDDELDDDQKVKFVYNVKFPTVSSSSPYNYTRSPFGETPIITSTDAIKNEIDAITEEFGNDKEKTVARRAKLKKDDGKDTKDPDKEEPVKAEVKRPFTGSRTVADINRNKNLKDMQRDVDVAYMRDNESSVEDGLIMPIEGGVITSDVGERIHPLTGKKTVHKGIDIPAPEGTPILAAGSGKIITRQYSQSYGNVIYIQHDDNTVTKYAHMSAFGEYQLGDFVKQGDVIGYVGTTGMSSGNHLHFEVRDGAGYRAGYYSPATTFKDSEVEPKFFPGKDTFIAKANTDGDDKDVSKDDKSKGAVNVRESMGGPTPMSLRDVMSVVKKDVVENNVAILGESIDSIMGSINDRDELVHRNTAAMAMDKASGDVKNFNEAMSDTNRLLTAQLTIQQRMLSTMMETNTCIGDFKEMVAGDNKAAANHRTVTDVAKGQAPSPAPKSQNRKPITSNVTPTSSKLRYSNGY